MAHLAPLLLMLSLAYPSASTVAMERLADAKLCADEDCAYTISMARAIEDFIAPDCRFINVKKGQLIYVYSKLLPEEGTGVFWSGSVYSDRYVDQMGVIGYFPSNLVTEIHMFKDAAVKVPTTDIDFYCI